MRDRAPSIVVAVVRDVWSPVVLLTTKYLPQACLHPDRLLRPQSYALLGEASHRLAHTLIHDVARLRGVHILCSVYDPVPSILWIGLIFHSCRPMPL